MLIRPSNAAIALGVVLVGVLLTTLIPYAPLRDVGHVQAAESSIDYAENGDEAVASFTADDQDGDPIEWSLNGPDKDLFDLSADGVLTFKSSPDFEDKQDVGKDNVYNVTLHATGGSHDVVVTVTNVDEPGSVSLSNPQPQVGRQLKADLTEDDGGVSGQEWQWARSEDGTEWTDISGATTDSRTPTADDLGMYLRATVDVPGPVWRRQGSGEGICQLGGGQDAGECTAVICRAGRGRKHE